MSDNPNPSDPSGDARYQRWREWLLDYKASTGFTWAKIGAEVGYAEASLCLFGAGKYPVVHSTSLLNAIEAFSRLVEGRSALAPVQFVITSVARAINKAIWQTQLLRRIGIVAGDSGIGKSEAVRNHAAGSPHAAYVTLNPHIKTAYSLLPKMLAAIGHPVAKTQPPHVLYERLVESTKDTSWFFLIDEANSLGSEALNTLRCFQDETGVPIILFGNSELYQNAQWTARTSVSSAAFTQFESRCAVRVHLTASNIKRNDVIAIAQQLIGLELTEACADVLLRQAQSKPDGAIRHLVTVLQVAQADRKDPSKPVTKQEIALAIEKQSRKSRRAAA